MLATARRLADRLAGTLLLLSVYSLTIGDGALVALFTATGGCTGGTGSGCGL
jgi:hypothetical protein